MNNTNYEIAEVICIVWNYIVSQHIFEKVDGLLYARLKNELQKNLEDFFTKRSEIFFYSEIKKITVPEMLYDEKTTSITLPILVGGELFEIGKVKIW